MPQPLLRSKLHNVGGEEASDLLHGSRSNNLQAAAESDPPKEGGGQDLPRAVRRFAQAFQAYSLRDGATLQIPHAIQEVGRVGGHVCLQTQVAVGVLQLQGPGGDAPGQNRVGD